MVAVKGFKCPKGQYTPAAKEILGAPNGGSIGASRPIGDLSVGTEDAIEDGFNGCRGELRGEHR